MSRTTGRIPGAVTRLALFGGGGVVAYTYLEDYITPFIPLLITIVGSLIAGFIVRYIFVVALNRRLISAYRYTNTRSNTQTQSQQKRVDNAQSRAASRESPINTPPDSLSLYRNLLGLGPRFTDEELRAAYRNAAAMYHPDRYAAATRKERETAEDLMKKVNEAYETLRVAAM
ncbi:MAG: J domain-containing protein [Treponema sp.]|nr:J domain-containing protein [Treponema sp.]